MAVGGAFRIPLALRYLTMNGTDVNVMLIRTGAKTLWIAEMLIQKSKISLKEALKQIIGSFLRSPYAMTKVLAPAAKAFDLS